MYQPKQGGQTALFDVYRAEAATIAAEYSEKNLK